MKHIENQVFYHIQRLEAHKVEFWKSNDSYFIGEEKNPFTAIFDYKHYPLVNDDTIRDILGHYQMFTRETIFEEVRKKYFANLPSRLSCLWVIPDNNNSIEYWKKELCENNECRLLKLNLTGIIHKTNQSYLKLNLDPIIELREKAFKYWNGGSGAGSDEDEYLFQGFAEVLEVKKI